MGDIFDRELTPQPGITLGSQFPLRPGWYRLKISGIEHHEIVEVRLDFGLGFVGHHSVRASAEGEAAELFVRLFKEVSAVELLRTADEPIGRSLPEISFERLPASFVWRRRALEQLFIAGRLMRAKRGASRHERPRRLWGWSGLQAFPITLPATGESSFELWKRVTRHDRIEEPNVPGFGASARSDKSRSDDLPRHGSWSICTTVIITTRNRADLLQRCVDSIFARTCEQPLEIIIHDNGSDEAAACRLLEHYAMRENIRVTRDELPFNFSRINNEAAALAKGKILIFLNNDTEVVSEDWIDRLAEVAADPAVGCAGPLLLTREGVIQHAGLVTGPGGVAAHVHAGLRREEVDPVAPIVRRCVSAVTGACLAIEKAKFERAGGFDSEGLPVAFNDVDLCLRLEREGLRNMFVPEATLVHVGSATREGDDFTTGSDRFRAEFRLMRERWGSRLDADPYFPPYMRLTRAGPQLRLA
jgi:GT2 family glycosyltransferase